MAVLSLGFSGILFKCFINAGERFLSAIVVDGMMEPAYIIADETDLSDVIATRHDIELIASFLQNISVHVKESADLADGIEIIQIIIIDIIVIAIRNKNNSM